MPELICAADDPAWREHRRTGVTATDIVTILGLSSWNSPYSLYYQKRGELPDIPDSDRFRLGRELERYVVSRWLEDRPSLTSARQYITERPQLLHHSERAWQMATADRLLGSYDSTDLIPVELKTWADGDKPSWEAGPPPPVRAQVLWQMDVMGVATGHVGVVFLPSGEFRSYVIEHEAVNHFRDEAGSIAYTAECQACEDIDLMREAGDVFYMCMLGELPPPSVDGSAATLAAVRARFPAPADRKVVPVDPQLWRNYLGSNEVITEYTGKKRAAESLIREALGEATDIEVDGQVVARRRVYDAKVKAHTRHVDGIWPVTPNGGTSDV